MRKLNNILLFIVFAFTCLLCSSCKKYKYKVNEYTIRSIFNETEITLKCRCNMDWNNINYQDGKYFITDLELKDLKNKTNGKLYYEASDQLVFIKDGSYFVIKQLLKLNDGDYSYQLTNDYCVVVKRNEFSVTNDFIRIPFPKFLVPFERTDLEDAYFPVYTMNETIIDNNYRAYLVDYYKNLGKIDNLSEWGDHVNYKINDPFRERDFNIQISYPEDGDILIDVVMNKMSENTPFI
ncbi:MAG: hypothetical protein J6Y28_09575 [Acholeplasmatales bacterium]|nr:hypothetical protein [Acholeplasmatales bacterium]